MGKVIAIDGPSGAGKSTMAKLIAKELGFDYLDTGSLYRTVALALREKGIEPNDPDDKILKALNDITVTFKGGRVFLKNASRFTPHDSRSNGRDVSEDIRSKEVDYYSSVFSAKKVVRDFLFDIQRNAASINDIVVEGRDIATVVFPDAWKKVYLDASLKERAKRRCLQFRERGIYISMEESRRDVMERDTRDSNRDTAPLKRAGGALLIDSSNLSIEQVKEKILKFIRAET
ncbi:MAG: (d)CMP kinase [Thermodesulfovibrionales bacterium]|nr:(d)CMP kinase [Thermodesulfovibrionales bacterium]